jgi:hypothetical protein
MKNKAHLTPSGLEEIRKLKYGMNRGRKSYSTMAINRKDLTTSSSAASTFYNSNGKINLVVAPLACTKNLYFKSWGAVSTPVPLYKLGMKAKPLFNVGPLR